MVGIAALPGCATKLAAPFSSEQRDSMSRGEAAEDTRERLLVRTASATVAVASVPEAVAEAEATTARLGGRVQSSRTEKDAPAHLEIRVPSDRLSQALDAFAALGEERVRNVGSADVTDEVADLEAELVNKQALRERLRALRTSPSLRSASPSCRRSPRRSRASSARSATSGSVRSGSSQSSS